MGAWLARMSACRCPSRSSPAGTAPERGRVDGPGQDRQRALQLAGVTAERGEQGVSGVRRGAVVVARHRTPARSARPGRPRARPRPAAARGGRRGARRARRAARPRSPAAGCGRTARADPAGPARPAGRERGQRPLVPHVGRRRADPRHQPTPQLGLPREVLGQRSEAVGVVARAPRPHQVHGAGAAYEEKQPGQPVGDGVATARAQLALLAVDAVPEVSGRAWRTTARRAQSSITSSSGQTRRSGSHGSSRSRPSSIADQRARAEEAHPRAHAVAAARAGAESVGEALGEPALDTLGRHHHDLLLERVVQRRGEQRAEPVREQVGARRRGAHGEPSRSP